MTIQADAKTLLELTDATFDAVLALVIPGVLADAEDFVGIKFQEETSIEEYFDGGVSTLYLSYVNVSAVSVEVDGVALSSDEFTVSPEAGKIRYGGSPLSGFDTASEGSGTSFTSGKRNVKVTYAGGYGEDAIPVALRSKLLKQITYEFRRRRDPGLSAVSFPDGTVNKFAIGEWLPDVEKTLERLRRIML